MDVKFSVMNSNLLCILLWKENIELSWELQDLSGFKQLSSVENTPPSLSFPSLPPKQGHGLGSSSISHPPNSSSLPPVNHSSTLLDPTTTPMLRKSTRTRNPPIRMHIDVHNAFHNRYILEEVYLHIPEGFCRQGETQKKPGDEIVVILVYVDDLLVTGNNLTLINQARADLQHKFKMKDLGDLKFFLGIDIARSKEGIVLSQRKYALEIIPEAGLSGAKPPGTPLKVNQKLTSAEYDDHISYGTIDGDAILKDPAAYQRLIGRLPYRAVSRPNLSFAVQVLSQYMHCPKTKHIEAALRVVRYIKASPSLGLFMHAETTNKLTTFCDSDWGACLQTKKLVAGYVVKFGDALISSKLKKQEIVSRSSAGV
ncbi:uncharacterized mitochondrial protein AtMg00810-like [Capsicum annuum]|uniref:uncharacterized mitochondrial protein AtMg00810-like n=1 Tax=Capsicum annuum TaxID=4072 RepID=UPI001FB1212F|nr:uncharacterized mitochondrial protein AtMg00810-like [Capsicum annuum]